MSNSIAWRWMMGVCLLTLTATAWAEDAAEAVEADEAVEAAEMQMPTQAEMMAQYMTMAEPGAAHEALAPLVGTFTAECESYCDPSGNAQTFTGTQTSRFILGGRFLESEYEGEMMGMPFQGFGLVGYDNVNQKYINLWADTMSTTWMTAEGSADETGKVFTLIGSYDDPIAGQAVTMRQVTTIIDDDHYTFEMFGPNMMSGSDEEVKMMKINYTRQQ